MSKRSKRYKTLRAKTENKVYPLDKAILLLKQTASTQFDESVELHVKLGTDPKKTDQTVKGTVTLPHGTGKKVKIAVFTETKQKEGKNANADIVGGKELIEEIVKTQKAKFDIAIATPDFMKNIAKAAKILGTKGLMPSLKNGTVTDDIEKTVLKIQSGQVSYRNDNSSNIHQIVGKSSWEEKKLKENIQAFMSDVSKSRPKGVKGKFIQGITICTTMGPGIKVVL